MVKKVTTAEEEEKEQTRSKKTKAISKPCTIIPDL